MDFEELKERYKTLKVSMRIGIIALVALCYPFYYWYENQDILAVEQENLEADLASKKSKYRSSRQKMGQLSDLEKKIYSDSI